MKLLDLLEPKENKKKQAFLNYLNKKIIIQHWPSGQPIYCYYFPGSKYYFLRYYQVDQTLKINENVLNHLIQYFSINQFTGYNWTTYWINKIKKQKTNEVIMVDSFPGYWSIDF